MNMLRRKFLHRAGFVAAAVSLSGTAVLLPGRAIAAYSKAGFEAQDVSGALKGSLGSDQHSQSEKIKLKAPDIAENGAVVPITVSSSLDNVEAISIIAKTNPAPLTSLYRLSPNSEAFVSTRIKMGKTSDIVAVLKADGKLYSATKEVKVTIGGCGG